MPIFRMCRDCKRTGTKTICPCGGRAAITTLGPLESRNTFTRHDFVIADMLWDESVTHRGYWRDMPGVGRATLHRIHSGWQFAVRDQDGASIASSAKLSYDSAEQAAQAMLVQLQRMVTT